MVDDDDIDDRVVVVDIWLVVSAVRGTSDDDKGRNGPGRGR